jgi:IS4 transposase
MLLGPVFERFVEQSPVSVLVEGVVRNALPPSVLDQLFRRHAQRQYTRELLFSGLVDLMGQVVCGARPSVCAAYQAGVGDIAVSLTALYHKLNGVETQVSAELVRHTVSCLGPVLEQLGAALPAWVPGYRTRILDGNHLAATEHRLFETRSDSAAPLPGQALVFYDPRLMLIEDVFPCEDGHAQERALLDEVVARLRQRDLVIADRNFCVRQFLLAILAQGGCFAIREHQKLAWETAGRLYGRGRIDGARVREQRVSIRNDQDDKVFLRRVVLDLDEPTRDGEKQLAVLTNLPDTAADARAVGRLYRRRWPIETAFQELACALQSEIDTLCYPKAALFAFCCAVVAYNLMGVVKGAVRAVHGPEAAEELSGYYLADEIAGTRRGLLIAIPEEHWDVFPRMTAAELAAVLRELAGKMRLASFRRHRRGPKKPPVKRTYEKDHPHVSTAKLLEKRRQRDKTV